MSTWVENLHSPASFDYADNEAGSIEKLQELNEYYRQNRWPSEFSKTTHKLIHGDARTLSFLPNESVHLVVTSPPYWTLKEYNEHESQLGHVADYDSFLEGLAKVWKGAYRVLVPGGRLVCVVGDVCLS